MMRMGKDNKQQQQQQALAAPLMPAAAATAVTESPGSVLVHNSRSRGHFISGKDGGSSSSSLVAVGGGAAAGGGGDGGSFEAIPMDTLHGGGKRLHHRRRGTSPTTERHPPPSQLHGDGSNGEAAGAEAMTYVMHVIEPHHTLQGIALQYRVTVDQLKRFNSLWTNEELHTREVGMRIHAGAHPQARTCVQSAG